MTSLWKEECDAGKGDEAGVTVEEASPMVTMREANNAGDAECILAGVLGIVVMPLSSNAFVGVGVA